MNRTKKDKKFTTISIDDASETITDHSIIKNFIVSDNLIEKQTISLEHPTFIEKGIVFALCIKGRLRLKIDLREFEITKNTLITVGPGSICEVTEKSEDLLIEFLFFSIEFTYGLNIPKDIDVLEKIGKSPCLNLTDEQFENLLDFHSFIVKQYKRISHRYRETLVKNLLASFLTETFSIYSESEKNHIAVTGRREEIFHQFGKLLLQHIKEERTVQFYADKMCLSPKYLSQLIKEISGKPIMEWINEITIVIIKAALKTTTNSILQISEELNFPNPSFFGRYFKKHTGMTPLQYRES